MQCATRAAWNICRHDRGCATPVQTSATARKELDRCPQRCQQCFVRTASRRRFGRMDQCAQLSIDWCSKSVHRGQFHHFAIDVIDLRGLAGLQVAPGRRACQRINRQHARQYRALGQSFAQHIRVMQPVLQADHKAPGCSTAASSRAASTVAADFTQTKTSDVSATDNGSVYRLSAWPSNRYRWP